MSDEQRTQDAHMLEVDRWATEALAAMLERVKAVCISEYQWLIDDLQAGK